MLPLRFRDGGANPKRLLETAPQFPTTQILTTVVQWGLMLIPALGLITYVILNGVYDFGGPSPATDQDDDSGQVRWDDLPPALIFPEQLHLTTVYYTNSYMTLRGLRTVSRDSRELLRSPALYAGLGIGNTAWLGYRDSCDVPLDQFAGVGIDATLERLGTSASNLSLAVMVAIDGDGDGFWGGMMDCIAQVDYAVHAPLLLQNPGVEVSVDLLASQPVWKSVGGAQCGGLPGHPGATGAAIDPDEFLPNAKLFCGDTDDPRFPRRTPMHAVQWRIGHHDFAEFAEMTAHRARLVVGTTQTTYNMDALN